MRDDSYVPKGSWLTFIRMTIKPKRGVVNGMKSTALYKCRCGNIIETCVYNVRGGSKKSCGCLRKHVVRLNVQNITHGLSNHPLYKIFGAIKYRCYNLKSNRYHVYGGNGVTICDEWINNPHLFIKWALENGWKKGMEIDKDIKAKKLGRIGNVYSPDMCSVVTPQDNSQYRPNIKHIEYGGKKQSIREWAVEIGVNVSTIHERLKTLPIEMVLSTERFSGKQKIIEYKGKAQSIQKWCNELGICRASYYDRVEKSNGSLDFILRPKK